MPLAVTEEHRELERTVRRVLDGGSAQRLMRVALEAPEESLGALWELLCAQGWLGLAVRAEAGGEGFGLFELAVVMEQLGRFALPGPFLPTALLALVLGDAGTPEQVAGLLPRILDGTTPAGAVLPVRGAGGMAVPPFWAEATSQGTTLVLDGRLPVVLCAQSAGILLVPALPAVPGDAENAPEDWIWCLVDSSACRVEGAASLDRSRRVAPVVLDQVRVPEARQLHGITTEEIARAAAVLLAAECAGMSSWCLDTANEHAKQRVQFGRPIGSFQAVKHRLADMLIELEQVVACTADAADAFDEWRASRSERSSRGDSSRGSRGGLSRDVSNEEETPVGGPAEGIAACDLAISLAAAKALDGAVEIAKGTIQVLGGIGFTWEHDAHVYLRRATALRQLAGPTQLWRTRAARMALEGVRRRLHLSLPPEAGAVRARIAEEIEALARLPKEERRRGFADGGWIAPHWPRPWGQDATAIEQIVIDEEMARAGLWRPSLAVGAWALPTIIAHGTEDQQRRFVGPTLAGELEWCQLFSEPEAGSDLASLRTRAERAEGGWLLSGQKVWTSMAAQADFGICLARSDPEAERHEGITYFLVDMHSPGVDVRPLRELTGDAMFNEVFLDEVFVPDSCVVGEPGDGWRIARATLANERVSLSSGSTFGAGVEALIDLVRERSLAGDGALLGALGGLLAEAQALAAMGQRATLRAVHELEPGAEASVRKLLGAEHEQRVQELALSLLGPLGALEEGDGARFGRGFLVTRCLTIAGGTSEVQRNVIAERILGLPRDPDIKAPTGVGAVRATR